MSSWPIKNRSIIWLIALISLTTIVCDGSRNPSSIRQEIRGAAKTGAEELNLSNWGLADPPPEIADLTYLTELHLSFNRQYVISSDSEKSLKRLLK